jgi:UDP-N-acetylmuramoyl-tripeptide--D-alanyl-D-alanine ligase|tara:strand:+ start:1906 stop:3258 length:1353 start_codon:yes stop_codon:yes gene_type:complete
MAMRININKSEILSQIIKKITGETLTTPITGITTDSRDCKPGDLYIALLGNRSDGHDFLYQVDNINAAAALVSKENTTEKLKLKQICVQDTNKVLGMIANKWRKNYDIPVIAITGSNGKTSTKELLYHILKEKYNVHATEGNYNTSIGLPLSLLGLNKSHDISIIEMGANQPGDIKYLCEIAEPTHGLITNISSAHLEGFQTIENIVDTKGSLFKYLRNGISFINYADERIKSINNIGQKITYGLNANCDFPADIHRENDGSITLTIDAQEIKTKSKNLSFAKNIIAVSAVSITLGIEWKLLQEKILTFKPPKGRCKVITYNSITIIDDTYNANLESCIAAIDYLNAFSGSGRKILVLGDMLELGTASTSQHEKLGSKCSAANLDAVFTIGKRTLSTQSTIHGVPINLHYNNSGDLISSLKSQLQDNDKILFKGSRGMKMEKIISGVFKA